MCLTAPTCDDVPLLLRLEDLITHSSKLQIMPRNQNALAIVNAAFLVKLGRKNVIQSASIVYGNIDPEFIHATKTERYLVGKNIFTDENLQGALKMLCSELQPVELPGEPSILCRKKLALGLFYKVRITLNLR